MTQVLNILQLKKDAKKAAKRNSTLLSQEQELMAKSKGFVSWASMVQNTRQEPRNVILTLSGGHKIELNLKERTGIGFINGQSGSGKTVLSLDLAGQALRQGCEVVYIEREAYIYKSANPKHGLATAQMQLLNQHESFTITSPQNFLSDVSDRAKQSGKPFVAIVDEFFYSLNSIQLSTILETVDFAFILTMTLEDLEVVDDLSFTDDEHCEMDFLIEMSPKQSVKDPLYPDEVREHFKYFNDCIYMYRDQGSTVVNTFKKQNISHKDLIAQLIN